MSDTLARTEAENVADLVRSAAAWWQLSADALENGRLDDAVKYAYLGHLGTFDMRERISALVNG